MKTSVKSNKIRPRTAWFATVITVALSSTNVVLAEVKPDKPAVSAMEGEWVMDGGKHVMQIAPCLNAVCGTIVRPLEPKSTDKEVQAMVGWQLLRDFKPASDGQWQGRMVNIADGKSYECLMRLEPSGRLWVRPYIGVSLIGKTHMWSRVDDKTSKNTTPTGGSDAH
ncbi:MAG: DUF2147 domain-containing protein [Pseudomonadota bacterium]